MPYFALNLLFLKKIQHYTIEFIAMLDMGPMAAAGKYIHASILKTTQREKPNIQSARSIILPPYHDRSGFNFDEIAVKVLRNRRAVLSRNLDQSGLPAALQA